jgi:hypothetical protein
MKRAAKSPEHAAWARQCMLRRARWEVRQQWAQRGSQYATALDFAQAFASELPKMLRFLDGAGVTLTVQEIMAELPDEGAP